MRLTLLLLSLLIAAPLSAQTYQLESENLSKRKAEEGWSGTKFAERAAKWRDALQDVDGYPKLSYSEELGRVFYQYEITNDSKSASELMDLTHMWANNMFPNNDQTVSFKSYKDSSMVINARFTFVESRNAFGLFTKGEAHTQRTGYYTIFISAQDGGLLATVDNINVSMGGYIGTGTNKEYAQFDVNMNMLLPVSDLDHDFWRQALSILKGSDNAVDEALADLDWFINNYDKRYTFN